MLINAVGSCNSNRYQTFHDISLGLQEGRQGNAVKGGPPPHVGGWGGAEGPPFWGYGGPKAPPFSLLWLSGDSSFVIRGAGGLHSH